MSASCGWPCPCEAPAATTEDIYVRVGDTGWTERKPINAHMHPPCCLYHRGATCDIGQMALPGMETP